MSFSIVSSEMVEKKLGELRIAWIASDITHFADRQCSTHGRMLTVMRNYVVPDADFRDKVVLLLAQHKWTGEWSSMLEGENLWRLKITKQIPPADKTIPKVR